MAMNPPSDLWSRRLGAAADQANGVCNEPCGRERAALIPIPVGHELDDVEGGDTRLFRDAADHTDGLPIAESAGSRPDHRRHDRGIEPVAIDGDEDVRPGRHKLERTLDTVLVYLVGQHEIHAGIERVAIIRDAGAAGTARADLDDALDPAHLARPAHRAGEAELDPLDLV